MPGRVTQKLGRAWTILIRACLILLLLTQLTVAWILSHAAPTRLPASVLGLTAELFAGRMDFDCREVTVDNRGRIRLADARLSDSEHPDDALVGDMDVLPDWRSLLAGRPGLSGLHIRGRGTIGGETGSAVDDLVVRLASNDGTVTVQVAARAGSMILRADAVERGEPGASPDAPGTDGLAWNRDLILNCLRGLRSAEGAIGFTSTPNLAACSGGFVENPAAPNPFPVRIGRGILRGHLGNQPRLELSLDDLRVGDASLGRAWLSLGAGPRMEAVAEGIRIDGLDGATASASGGRQPDGTWALRVLASSAQSRVSLVTEVRERVVRLRDVDARLCAADLTRLSPIAQAARATGVDLGGHIEILGGEAAWMDGELSSLSGAFALGESGWGDLRPTLVRPERPFPRFSGELSMDVRANQLDLTRLDLAGIQGEITGGLRAGDAFAIHLRSSPDNPVNPSCLNALLGAWWVDLWSRFDLSTDHARPRADVRVIGKWGAPESIHTTVRAQLDNFGFMGARFRGTDLWVFAHPGETLLRIDSLRGDLDGQDAGGAHGTVRWDWRRPEWNGQPQIDAEGDMLPACALRLHDPVAAARIRGWTLANPLLRVSLGPDRPLRATLESAGTSSIGGVKVDGLRLIATRPPGPTGDLMLEATGSLSGGKASLALSGDLKTRNRLQVSIREWSRTGAANLIEQLGGPAAGKVGPDGSSLTVFYEGDLDFTQPRNPTGKGRISLLDPNLKTIHLFGLVSSGLDALGIGVSSYPLDRAEVSFSCKDGQAELDPLRFIGNDASLNLKGTISLQDGTLRLAGRFQLKDSPWGPLKYINPNRLMTNMISVDIRGTVNEPDVRTKILDLSKVK